MPFRYYRVMQTARRAAASIADAGEDGMPVRYLIDDVGIGRRAVVRLEPPYHVRDTHFLAQQTLEMGEVAPSTSLAFEMKPTALPCKDESLGASVAPTAFI